jgi:hypothetical protein
MAGEFIADTAFDNGLTYLDTNGETLYITSQVATTYTEANSTYALGDKNTVTIGVPEAGATDGRRVIVSAITDGDVTGTGTATHWALCKDSATSELLATGPLTSSQAVTSGNTFTTDALSITFRDATVT